MANARAALQPFLTEEAEAHGLAARMPALLVEARRVAHTVTHGTHGRRQPGPGETFWQFRPFDTNDSVAAIDWRRSASSDRLFVRDANGKRRTRCGSGSTCRRPCDSGRSCRRPPRRAAPSCWRSGSPNYWRAPESASASWARAPSSGRFASRKVAEVLLSETADGSLPPPARLNRFSECVLFSDFLEPIDQMVERFHQIASQGVRGHLVQILDPAEETLPYSGRTEFEASEGGATMIAGRAEDLREKYQKRIERHRLDLQEVARQLGWSFVVHHTDRPAEEVLLAIHGQLAGQDRDYRYRAARGTAEPAPAAKGAGS
ncbi:hypothetical protein AUC70_12660 [Methyloceanibacter stevinii]|uniref:DUF58 domain-containing protein n=1 Tax=Methyloceanibacter stevinii TaxID=1774970 RepID=A0A1E3VUB8_9HYPH|nr:DUF58 domain-containing protein [Methyloceanibacter stevinii]ODR97123.1 hypothetical protein AUC70_12660 [Methyloceanibacter stevinii]